MNRGTQTIETKKVATIKAIKSELVINAIVKPTKKVASNFKATQNFNKAFKLDANSVGKLVSNMLTFNKTSIDKLDLNIVAKLQAIKDNKANEYENILKVLTPCKKGLFSSYKLLMLLRK
jgi:hypothetical protein